MPGVPNSKGCEACRRQKKKCDAQAPVCGRCKRLAIPCIGSGQRRFMFKDESALHGQHSAREHKHLDGALIWTGNKPDKYMASIPLEPCSPDLSLCFAFVTKLQADDDLRFDLTWAYGPFMREIPRRLGRSAALDAAADVLLTSHNLFCIHQGSFVPPLLYRKHNRALVELRGALEEPAQAQSADTLCAVLLLMICQRISGASSASLHAHAEGAAHILALRKRRKAEHHKAEDSFERMLQATLQAPLIISAVDNPRIHLDSDASKAFGRMCMAADGWNGRAMYVAACCPDWIRRGTDLKASGHDTSDLAAEIRAEYNELQIALGKACERLITMHDMQAGPDALPTATFLWTNTHQQRLYCISLGVALAVNMVLRALDPPDASGLVDDAACFNESVFALETELDRFRPLGAAAIILPLTAMWCAAVDGGARTRVETLLAKYRQFNTESDGEELEHLRRRLNLLTSV